MKAEQIEGAGGAMETPGGAVRRGGLAGGDRRPQAAAGETAREEAAPQETTLRAGRRLGADPLFQWLIFTGLSLFAFMLLGYFGHLQRMATNDRTLISPAIVVIYLFVSGHCFWRSCVISREMEAALDVARAVVGESGFRERGDAAGLPARGLLAAHIRDLAAKARLQAKGRLDQTLLLRALASRLRGSSPFGAFAGDMMMKLGLLGTVIGFIMTLAPIAGLDMDNQGAVKSSLAQMSDGMAVAMYTTLSGLAAALLLRIQYGVVEHATARLFAFAVEVTEVHVTPLLERKMGGEA